ncbi:MAG: carbohydrate ABC transporter permease [Paenibacillaceae bacterium]
MKKKWNYHMTGKVVPYLVLSLIGIAFIVPLLWMIFASIDPNANLMLKIPKHITLNNLKDILTNTENQRAFINGIFLSLGQAVLVVIVAGLAAYPLSRYSLRYKSPFMYLILFSTSLPITAVMVPVYQLFVTLKLQDSLIGVMIFLTASSLPYAIWMMKNFMDSIPLELEEAAWVDGSSIWKALRVIITPLLLPGIFTVGIFTFSGSWGNFFVPFILIQTPEKMPASVSIYQFFGSHGMVEYGKLAAFSIIYTIPTVVLYVLSQRFMSKGFSFGGATKG